MKKHKIILVIIVTLILTSCSSAPRNTGDIFHLRLQAETLLESANKEASRGNYNNSLIIVNESKRYALLCDDSSLIIRTSLTRGNVLYYLGRTDDAFDEWEQAIKESIKHGDIELLSVSRIYYARGNLLSGRASAQSVLEEVIEESVNITKDRLYIAFSWQVRGFALRALDQWEEAESAINQSLQLHESNRYFDNTAYDWYTIASIRSLSGKFDDAIYALVMSIYYDRRVENSWGLAASYRAMGDVYHNAEMHDEAIEAYKRSRAIYDAMGNEYEIFEVDTRLRMYE